MAQSDASGFVGVAFDTTAVLYAYDEVRHLDIAGLHELAPADHCQRFVSPGPIPWSGEIVSFTCDQPGLVGVMELRFEQTSDLPPQDYRPLGREGRLVGQFRWPDGSEVYELELDSFSANESTWTELENLPDDCE